MFFSLAIVAALGYSLQSTLMASYYRRIDRLSAVAYRGISLGISMLPLLFFVPFEEFWKTPQYFILILLASVLAALGNWAIANAYRRLPIGIATACAMSFSSVNVAIISFAFLGERLSFLQLLFIGLILLGVILLGVSRSQGILPTDYDLRRGLSNCFVFGLFLGAAYALVGIASRQLDPFIVGYLWEFIIGLVAAMVAIGRGYLGGLPLTKISRKDFAQILVYSAPTAIGTGCYALAMTIGPIGIAAALISTMMVFSTLFAYFLYGETLGKKQWCLLMLVWLMVAGLKFSTS